MVGDWRTSASECICPEEECTTMMFCERGFSAGVVVVATDWRCFWKPAAVKPGDARRMGFDETSLSLVFVVDDDDGLNSSWRRSVSKVSWKNFDKAYEAYTAQHPRNAHRPRGPYNALAYLVVITGSRSLSRDSHFHFLFQNRLELPDKTDIRKTLVHDHSYGLCSSFAAFIHRLL